MGKGGVTGATENNINKILVCRKKVNSLLVTKQQDIIRNVIRTKQNTEVSVLIRDNHLLSLREEFLFE